MTEFTPETIADILERNPDRATKDTPPQSRKYLAGKIDLQKIFGHSRMGERSATLNEELVSLGFSGRQIALFRSAWQQAALSSSGIHVIQQRVPQPEAGEYKTEYMNTRPGIDNFRSNLVKELAELQHQVPQAFVPGAEDVPSLLAYAIAQRRETFDLMKT